MVKSTIVYTERFQKISATMNRTWQAALYNEMKLWLFTLKQTNKETVFLLKVGCGKIIRKLKLSLVYDLNCSARASADSLDSQQQLVEVNSELRLFFRFIFILGPSMSNYPNHTLIYLSDEISIIKSEYEVEWLFIKVVKKEK